MKAAFHYIVKARLIRQTENNELGFEEINKTFENENPIIAREQAFNYYQSWIDILLQHKGKEYVSDREARKDLITFIEPGSTTKLQAGGKEIEFSDDSFGNGIGVYIVNDHPENSFSFLNVGDEGLIHGIGNLSDQFMIDMMIILLIEEAENYKNLNFETNNKEIEVTFCAQSPWIDGNAAIGTHKILRTPFNWEGYDKPYWWGNPEKYVVEQVPKTIEERIQGGENNQVEFKATLHYIKGKDTKIREDIAKTICAFLNSNGGFLFIGVKDNNTIEGLDYEYSLAKGKNPKDYFLLEYDNMLQNFIGLSIISNITGQFYEIGGKEIFYIAVIPTSKKRLIFLKGQEGKELYVRGEASTRQIKDAEEIINYWKERQVD